MVSSSGVRTGAGGRAEARLVRRGVVGSGNSTGSSSVVSCRVGEKLVLRWNSRDEERRLTWGSVGSSVGGTLVQAVLVSAVGGRGDGVVRVVVGRAVSVVRAVGSSDSSASVVVGRGVLVLRRGVVGSRKRSRGAGVVS